MNKRRQYLIDKKLQLKYTFSALGFISLIIAVIICLIGINVTYNNGEMQNISVSNDDIIKNLDKTMSTEDNILSVLLTWVQNPKQKPNNESIKDIAQSHFKELNVTKANVQTLKSNIDTIKQVIKYNTGLIILIIIIALIQGLLFFILMIRKTHKIAGPAHVMAGYCKEIAEGKNPEIRDLRAGDELQDLYEAFKDMAIKIRK